MSAIPPVRIGFVGGGWWATANHISRVGLTDIYWLGEAGLAQIQGCFGCPSATESVGRLLDDCPMDPLIATTPHRTHESQAPAALSLVRHDGERGTLDSPPDVGAYECLEPVDRFVALCAGEAVENAAPAACGTRPVEVMAAMLASSRSGRTETVHA